MTHRLCVSRTLLLAALLGIFVASTGCRKEEIRAYSVPKEKVRLLAAIIPHQNETWVFKLMGPDEEVGPQQNDFVNWLNSIQFPDKGEPITWQLPESWQQEKGDQMRYATIRLPVGLDITVSRFPKEQGLLANVNRWRGQMGLPKVEEKDLEQYCQKVKIAGESATIVRMDGIRPLLTESTLPPAPMASEPQNPTFTAPAGWKPAPAKEVEFAAFEFNEGGEQLRLTVAQAGGSIIDNINRWRGQAGLPKASEDLIMAEGRQIKVDDLPALYVDLENKDANKRIFGVICPQAGRSWFFKLTGPAELAGKQKSAFEAFVRSVRFNGG
ncbi:MAG TPA: hypothetical protein VGZ47_02550 [Gemmataceae bacterium]|jgi:hypothetical protein|nr:hypothetical protein [Gemmataceae bacterium]